MHWLDIVIIVVGVILGFLGWRMGILKAIALVVGIGVGIVFASRFNGEVADLLSRWIESPDTAKWTAYAIIFVVVMVAAMIVAGFARKILSLLLLGWADRLAGLALGILATFLIFSALLSAAQNFDVFGLPDAVAASTLGSLMADKFDVVLRGLKLIPGDFGLP